MFDKGVMGVLAAAGLLFGAQACDKDDDKGETGVATSAGSATDAGSSDSDESDGDESDGDESDSDETSNSDADDTTDPSGCSDSDPCRADEDCGAGEMCLDCICFGGVDTNDTNDTSDTSDTGGGSCTPGMCGDTCGTCEPCLTCAQGAGGECFAENQACNMDAECLAILMCTNQPGCNQACVQGCIEDHPDGVAGLQALIGCVFGGPMGGGACGNLCS